MIVTLILLIFQPPGCFLPWNLITSSPQFTHYKYALLSKLITQLISLSLLCYPIFTIFISYWYRYILLTRVYCEILKKTSPGCPNSRNSLLLKRLNHVSKFLDIGTRKDKRRIGHCLTTLFCKPQASLVI